MKAIGIASARTDLLILMQTWIFEYALFEFQDDRLREVGGSLIDWVNINTNTVFTQQNICWIGGVVKSVPSFLSHSSGEEVSDIDKRKFFSASLLSVKGDM